jgi:ADP-heptose:LPS heptosyltransferase
MSIARTLKRFVLGTAKAVNGALRRPQDGNCILVLHYVLPLGGCVHATPLYAALHSGQSLPVYVATRGLGAEVLRYNPDLAGVIVTPDVLSDLPGAVKALQAQLKQRGLQPRWTLMDASNQRSRIALLGFALGAPMAGYSQAEGLLEKVLRRDSANRSLIAENVAVAEAIGVPARISEPRVYVSPQVTEGARALLAQVNPNALPTAIFVTMGSGGQPTQWHDERFAAIIAFVAERGMLPVFAGTAAQVEAIDALRAHASAPSVSLAGQTSVPDLAALMALSDLCISIDTGPMHVARASGVPLVVLAPTYQSPVEWLPLQVANARVLRGPGIAPVPTDYKLDEIEVRQVQAAVDDLMRLYPPSLEAHEARVAAITTDVDHLPA